MDRLTSSAALAAVFVSFTVAGCGGGSATGTESAAATPAPAPSVQTVEGVSTPTSVSVVTAKNAN